MFVVEKYYLVSVETGVETLESKAEAKAAAKSGKPVARVIEMSVQLGPFALDVAFSRVIK